MLNTGSSSTRGIDGDDPLTARPSGLDHKRKNFINGKRDAFKPAV